MAWPLIGRRAADPFTDAAEVFMRAATSGRVEPRPLVDPALIDRESEEEMSSMMDDRWVPGTMLPQYDPDKEKELSRPAGQIGTHPGVILRIRFNGQTYMQADSDNLHYVARYGGHPMNDGWAEVLRTLGGLTIEVQATRLANDYPDPDDDDQAETEGQPDTAGVTVDAWLKVEAIAGHDTPHISTADDGTLGGCLCLCLRCVVIRDGQAKCCCPGCNENCPTDRLDQAAAKYGVSGAREACPPA